MSTLPVSHTARSELQRTVWEREMRRVRLIARVLGAALLAATARILASGLSVTSLLTAIIIAALLLSSLLLARYGHKVEARRQIYRPSRADPGARDLRQSSPVAGEK